MFEQVKLGYAFDALEPHIDTATVETHYGKHHAAYTKAFNDAAQKAGMQDLPAEKILSSLEEVRDPALRRALRNNGGGYLNHNLYFSTLSPNPQKDPDGKLGEAVARDFGGTDALKSKLKEAALGQFGSGWAWLCTDRAGNLTVAQSGNQDNPYSEGTGLVPILALDVWEHAYYLKYRNLRASYIDGFFEVLDWKAVGENYARAVRP